MTSKLRVSHSSITRSEEQVAHLVREHQRLVQYQVNRFLRRRHAPGVERDDLVSWGLLGLVQAARAWDPQRGAFSTIACTAIDWMLHRGLGREEKAAGNPTVSLDEILSHEEATGRQDSRLERLASDEHLERDLMDAELAAVVRGAVQRLPPVERQLIERHFFDGVPIARIAQEMGVSRQRAGERQRKALRYLRAALDPLVAA